jgi:HEPN pEK499 p136
MMPHEPVRDVMRRTIQNLEFIEAHRGPRGPYEVTQLLNSFLGAMAHPWEVYEMEICGRSLSEATASGWPRILKERPRDRDPDTLGDLVRVMRNAIAHGNVQFLPGRAADIQALKIWNEDRNGVRTWGAVITVRDMRAILTCFVRLAEEIVAKQGRSRLRRA